MQHQRERRYPPSPYPPHSTATSAYRANWDLGWRHLGVLANELILSFEAGLSGASRHGYRDGLIARWRYLERAKQTEPEILRDEAAQRDAARRAAVDADRPY
ncbi:hypothetical protein [Nocardioides sp.]|uniref:hypothetical protein n=1 Tax=Nocardioides sp. TaxID=35761 RepID=UPI0019878651|nr:hypothetical protein [Nocardioides sp.]MBC7279218.1 hypothetical protein [Nocardioides sp.]